MLICPLCVCVCVPEFPVYLLSLFSLSLLHRKKRIILILCNFSPIILSWAYSFKVFTLTFLLQRDFLLKVTMTSTWLNPRVKFQLTFYLPFQQHWTKPITSSIKSFIYFTSMIWYTFDFIVSSLVTPGSSLFLWPHFINVETLWGLSLGCV